MRQILGPMQKSARKVDHSKLFGFSQVEKVKSGRHGDKVVDRSAKIGKETRNKDLWSKVGDREN